MLGCNHGLMEERPLGRKEGYSDVAERNGKREVEKSEKGSEGYKSASVREKVWDGEGRWGSVNVLTGKKNNKEKR